LLCAEVCLSILLWPVSLVGRVYAGLLAPPLFSVSVRCFCVYVRLCCPYSLLWIHQCPSIGRGDVQTVIETSTGNVRYCLICNYVKKIIPALQSRCTKFRFPPLPAELVKSRLASVAAAEQYVCLASHWGSVVMLCVPAPDSSLVVWTRLCGWPTAICASASMCSNRVISSAAPVPTSPRPWCTVALVSQPRGSWPLCVHDVTLMDRVVQVSPSRTMCRPCTRLSSRARWTRPLTVGSDPCLLPYRDRATRRQ